jgi:hypothetical protein
LEDEKAVKYWLQQHLNLKNKYRIFEVRYRTIIYRIGHRRMRGTTRGSNENGPIRTLCLRTVLAASWSVCAVRRRTLLDATKAAM